MGLLVTDLVSMNDIEGLLRILDESEDWMDQMDAAEGLVRLGNRRGLEYLLIAKQSDIDDIQQTAIEILDDPEIRRMREQIEGEMRFNSQKLVEEARERIKKGKKVFLHKVLHISTAEIMQEDPSGDGFEILDLNDAGLQGWEVIDVIPRRQLVGAGETSASSAYVFLRKELGPGDEAELVKK